MGWCIDHTVGIIDMYGWDAVYGWNRRYSHEPVLFGESYGSIGEVTGNNPNK